MRLFKWRPLHGWRALFGEIGIIVAGVLIALGANQAVERWQWDREVAAGREALREDYKQIVANAEERQGLDGCLRARLNEVIALLDRTPGSLPAIGHLGSPPTRLWYPASWDSLVATEVTTHMPRDEMLLHAAISQSAKRHESRLEEEMVAWTTVYTIVGPARRLESGEAATIRHAATRAMYLLNSTRLYASQGRRDVISTDLLDEHDLAEIRQQVDRLRQGPNWRSTCGPIGTPNGALLQAPYDPAIQTNPMWRSDRRTATGD